MRHPFSQHPGGRRQAGLTLVELMVSIVIGMLMIAALATVIANQSGNRAEIDKSGRMIENGRYALQTLAGDIQLAGYWGQLNPAPAAPGAMPDPCSVTVPDLTAAMGLHVQGYDAPAPLAAPLTGCLSDHKSGTDVLVVRRADPDTSAIETTVVTGTGTVVVTDLTKVTAGQVYLQTGITPVGTVVTMVMAAASATPDTNSATFTLVKKDRTSVAALRKVSVNIYYVSTCSVCTGTPDTIPTLKRRELGVTAGAPALGAAITVAEGIENLQFDYGVDVDSNGAADGADVNGSALAVADWPNVMTMKIHLIARSNEATGGFLDPKTYVLGTAAPASAPADYRNYKRHAFVQSVRLVNPSGRRAL